MRRIYLDHNATTPLDPRVLEAMLPWLERGFGNPSSLHAEGRAARRALEDAREHVAALLGGEPSEIVFTSGATEANVLAVCNPHRGRPEEGLRLAVGATEHPAVLEPARALEARGAALGVLPVDGAGRLRLEALDAALEAGQDLVAVMAANNEVGTIQPWAAIAARCEAAGVALHVDAVQAAGKLPFDVADLPSQATAAISAHKIGGPKGVGALWIRRDTRVAPLLVGGGQEGLRRAGTENVAGIVGLGEAARLAREEGAQRHRALREAEAVFLEALRDALPSLTVHGPPRDDCLPGTLNLRLPGIAAEGLVFALDLLGVAISLGAACSSGAAQPSHVLAAMGVSKVENLESCRVTLGWTHKREDLVDAAARFAQAVRQNCSQREDL